MRGASLASNSWSQHALRLFLGLALIITLASSQLVRAASPSEVQRRLTSGEKLTLIDVRDTRLFTQGHIPGAINIPAALCQAKQLPPLGQVVVYDEGLGQTAAASAAAELSRKPGIQAEVLEGGLAAWEMLPEVAATRARGAQAEELPMISYDKLKQAPPGDLVLVDLRQPTTQSKVAAKVAQPTTNQTPLTDLATEFPGARVSRSPFQTGSTKKTAGAPGGSPLLVLIDQGDGRAQAAARALKAQGQKRFVILAGGEMILQRHGQAGLQRRGLDVGQVTTNQGSVLPPHNP